MRQIKVNVRGEGLAASCSAYLLTRAGFQVTVSPLTRPKLPAIMLSAQTQKLLEDVFENQNLFTGLPQVRKRVVAWGERSEPLILPHSAIVLSEEDLLERLQPIHLPDSNSASDQSDWTIVASRPLPATPKIHEFGSRTATASAVQLSPETGAESCFIESLEDGWLFLLPGSTNSGWLLAVGNTPELLLPKSTLVAKQVASITAPLGQFACGPQIAEPLSQPGSIACGTAALVFDPLCGDGAGNASREAILASAVIDAACQGGDVDELVAHYRGRLLGGFTRHLEICKTFYETGPRASWWDEQLEATQRGLVWCAEQRAGLNNFHYRLQGFALQRI